MKINIQSLHFKADNKLEKLVRDKLSKLAKLNERLLAADAVLKIDKSDRLDNKVCEIRMEQPGADPFAKAQSSTFEKAFAIVYDELHQQLLRQKTNIIRNRRKAVLST